MSVRVARHKVYSLVPFILLKRYRSHMPWNKITTGTSVLGRQTMNCRLGIGVYFSLVLPGVSVSLQKFWGTLSLEFLNTPTVLSYSQSQIVKVWTRSVVTHNVDPGNETDTFMFWRYAGQAWEAWRFDP